MASKAYDKVTERILALLDQGAVPWRKPWATSAPISLTTGRESRLNRKTVGEAAFGSRDYGEEELTAEVGAAFLAAEAGISPATIENSAAYIDGWRRAIKADTNAAQALPRVELAAPAALAGRHLSRRAGGPMISEKHRPQTFEEMVGNEQAVKLCRTMAELVQDMGESQVVLLSGASGLGKSTAAGIMARVAGATEMDITLIKSGQCNVEVLREVERDWAHTSLFSTAKVLVIEEIHTAKTAAVQHLLTFMETLTPHRLIVLTSNVEAGELFPGVYNSPFARRVFPIHFSAEGIATRKGKPGPGPLYVKRVLHAEGLDGNIGRALQLAYRDALLAR